MPATAEQAIQQLQIVYTVTGADQTEASGRAVASAHDAVATSTTRATTATAQMERQLTAALKAYNDSARATQQIAAANDNLSKSYSAANDNVRSSSDGWKSSIVQIADLTNHLKFAALAAYAVSPAFRAMVNPAITASVTALGPAAVSAGAAVIRAFTPALTFLASIAAPILLVVAAFVALKSVIQQGADLLEKYGNASRAFDSATAGSNLKKLTTFQGGDDVTSQDAQNAGDLATRLDQAKFRLQEFMKVHIDLNGYGLAFQRIWVNIVELVASVADTAGKFIDTFIKGLGELKNVITQIGSAIIDALWNNLPAPIQAMLQGHYPTATQSSGGTGGLVGSTATVSPADDASERAAALAAARKTLSAAMGVAAGGTDGANIGSTFAARWNTDIDTLVSKTPKATEAVDELRDAWDRAVTSIDKQTGKLAADTLAIGQSTAAHDQLRAEFQLLEAAQASDRGVTDAQIAQYAVFRASMSATQALTAAGIKLDADDVATLKAKTEAIKAAAQANLEAKVANDISFSRQTAFLSPEDVQIATQLKGLYPDVATALNSSQAAAMRLNDAFKSINTEAGTFASGFLKDAINGVDIMTSLANQAKRVAESVLDISTKKLISSALGSAFGDTASMATGATTAAGILTTAGTTLAAAMVAGATEASVIMAGGAVDSGAILVTSGGLTGEELSLMAGLAGTEIAVGGTVAATALDEAAAAIGLSTGNIIAVVAAVAAIAAAVGITAFGNSNKAADELQKAQINFAKMAGDITKFNAAAAGFTLSPLIGELTSLTQQWQTLAAAAINANNKGALADLQNTFQDGVGRIINNYLQLNVAMSDSAKAIAQAKSDADAMADSLHQAGLSMGQAATIAQEGLGTAIAKIKSDLAASLQANINTATGKGYINDISTLDVTRNQLLAEGNADPALIQASFVAQAQKIVDDAGLIGDAFNQLTTQFPDLSGAVQQSATALADQAKAAQDAADANTAAAKQLQDSLNGTAKTVVDYLNGLVSGQNSTLSPTAVLANAQQVYNANLALAQGGNADAEAKFPEIAENLRKAALAVFASGQGFQDIQNQIISQGLALPAVQQSTDPVVNAIRDSITAIQATTASVDLTRSSLNASLATGNLMTIAGVLNAYLPSIDTNADNAISLNEMITALGPNGGNVLTQPQLDALKLARDSTAGGILTLPQISALGLSQEQGNVLRVFQSLDGNGDGILQKSELIKQASQASATWNFDTADNVQESFKYLVAMYGQLSQQIGQLNSNNSTLSAIQGLQTTASQQLVLLNQQLAGSQSTVVGLPMSSGQATSINNTTVNNTLVLALNKIVANTWATVENLTVIKTQGIANITNGANNGLFHGQLASGGWISGGTPGRDSVPILAMPDEFMVNANATRALTRQFGVGIMETINAGRLPSNVVPFPVSPASSFHAGNDNSALLARIDKLTAEVVALRKDNNAMMKGQAKASRDDASGIVRAVSQTGRTASRDTRMAALKQRHA